MFSRPLLGNAHVKSHMQWTHVSWNSRNWSFSLVSLITALKRVRRWIDSLMPDQAISTFKCWPLLNQRIFEICKMLLSNTTSKYNSFNQFFCMVLHFVYSTRVLNLMHSILGAQHLVAERCCLLFDPFLRRFDVLSTAITIITLHVHNLPYLILFNRISSNSVLFRSHIHSSTCGLCGSHWVWKYSAGFALHWSSSSWLDIGGSRTPVTPRIFASNTPKCDREDLLHSFHIILEMI